MKMTKKVIIRISSVLFFTLGLLVFFLLNPSLSYAHSTSYKHITIYHQSELDSEILNYIDNGLEAIRHAEIYTSNLPISLCLNDGSVYPSLVEKVLGNDVFTAFANKVVMLGHSTNRNDKFIQWGEELSFTQFLSHGLMHNYQFHYHGLWDSNPLGNHEQWKWEGYADYIVLGEDRSLVDWICLLESDRTDTYDFMDLGKVKKTIRRHVEILTLVKYCKEIKGLNYDEFMNLHISEMDLHHEMILWYQSLQDV